MALRLIGGNRIDVLRCGLASPFGDRMPHCAMARGLLFALILCCRWGWWHGVVGMILRECWRGGAGEEHGSK
ncbi:hypothetical protein [Sphingomicrobium arenosum]|uniref:hypothetical protein n=1 Tax=Sphingomicrobium arenosum TaxID=2233861 RepID=UPI00223FB7FB|nr:hypothetical protein [Sphingomicrobium arenosum]